MRARLHTLTCLHHRSSLVTARPKQLISPSQHNLYHLNGYVLSKAHRSAVRIVIGFLYDQSAGIEYPSHSVNTTRIRLGVPVSISEDQFLVKSFLRSLCQTPKLHMSSSRTSSRTYYPPYQI